MNYTITLKLTEDQFQWLETTAKALSTKAGVSVSHGWIMTRLMDLGLPLFEKEHGRYFPKKLRLIKASTETLP